MAGSDQLRVPSFSSGAAPGARVGLAARSLRRSRSSNQSRTSEPYADHEQPLSSQVGDRYRDHGITLHVRENISMWIDWNSYLTVSKHFERKFWDNIAPAVVRASA